MSDYLDTLPIAKWFFSNYTGWHHHRFPGGGKTNYAEVLRSTHSYLNTNVHNTTAARAAALEKGLYLTDHGPDHIKMVMQRAQHLVAKNAWAQDENKMEKEYSACIDPYEAFLLLMAIHFHDVGNVYGRDGHEKRISSMMEKIPLFQALDGFEQNLIAKIASCHGGYIDGDKDTIGHLEKYRMFGATPYRPQLLAATLRLADELADERSRADNFALMDPAAIPEGCLIYHKYASALTSVQIDAASHDISLTFILTKDDTCKTFPLNGTEVYLLDFIYDRALKTYREMSYCSKFTRSLDCSFHQVVVTIEAHCGMRDFSPVKEIGFRIGDTGYPDDNHGKMENLARDYKNSPKGDDLAKLMNTSCP